MLNLCALLFSVISTFFVSLKNGVFENVKLIWIPIVCLVGFFILGVALIFAVLFVCSKFINLKKEQLKPNTFAYFLVKEVIRFLVQYARVKLHLTGDDKIDENKRYLFVSNHRSKFDPMIQLLTFSKCKPLMISKPENFKAPIAGPFIYKSGFLSINREDNREALKTILKATNFVNNYNVSIGICPEGTRNKIDRNLLPFKPGAFKIAMKTKAPIAIMTFEGTEKIHKNFPFRKTDVYLDVLAVLNYEDYQGKTTIEISDLAFKLMQANIDKYSSNIA